MTWLTKALGVHPHPHGHTDHDVKKVAEDDGTHQHFAPDHSVDSLGTESNPRESHLYVDARSSFASNHSSKTLTGDVTREQRETVRAALKGEMGCDDDMLCRFVHATGGNLPLVSRRGKIICVCLDSRLDLQTYLHASFIKWPCMCVHA